MNKGFDVQRLMFDMLNCEIVFDRLLSPTKDDSQSMSECVADENFGFSFINTGPEFFQADGRVDDDGDDAQLEERECEREELDAGRSHHNGAHAGGQRAGLKSAGEAVR